MIKIDLIIPSLISYQKYTKFRNFHKILKFQEIPFPSWSGNWFPVWLNMKNLERMGVKIRFLNFSNIYKKNLSETIGIDSRIINNLIFKYETLDATLKKALIPMIIKLRKNVDNILFFDNSDSSGLFNYELFPYIDRYFKKQLMKDRTLYKQPLYGKRLFTHFYAKNYKFDTNYSLKKEFNIDQKFYQKLGLSWNFAFKDYRSSNILNRFLYGLIRKNKLNFNKPTLNRKFLLAANYSIKKSFELVYFQRNELLKLLKTKFKSNPNMSLGRIPKRIYLKTMKSSQSVVSPYGWGEICYRDFETFIAGAALIKPDMDHLETWPDLYKKGKTYLSLPWKVEEWSDAFDQILSDQYYLLEIAKEGQKLFKKIWTEEGNKNFCEHFIDLIKN